MTDEEVCLLPTQCIYVSRAIPKQTAILPQSNGHRLMLTREVRYFLCGQVKVKFTLEQAVEGIDGE
jgi:hypothetical protein